MKWPLWNVQIDKGFTMIYTLTMAAHYDNTFIPNSSTVFNLKFKTEQHFIVATI